MANLKKKLLIIAGTLSVIAGIIGIVLPILPTTPFLLLAAICYMRSSERLYQTLIKNRIWGKLISNYLENRGMTLKAKYLTVALVWTIIGVSILLFTSSFWLQIVLSAVAIGVTIHISMIRTLSNDHSICSKKAL
jgi:uncharacterized protein